LFGCFRARWLIALGIVIVIFGAFLALMNFIGFLGMALVLIGVLVIIVGIFTRPRTWYQIKGVGLTQTELQLWRTDGVEADAKAFARFVQDQINTHEKSHKNHGNTQQ
jgi:membrane-bound ClpP family serine protease